MPAASCTCVGVSRASRAAARSTLDTARMAGHSQDARWFRFRGLPPSRTPGHAGVAHSDATPAVVNPHLPLVAVIAHPLGTRFERGMRRNECHMPTYL